MTDVTRSARCEASPALELRGAQLQPLRIARKVECCGVPYIEDSLAQCILGVEDLYEGAVRVAGIEANSPAGQIAAKVFRISAGLPLDSLVARKKVSRETLHQNRPGEALLNQECVVPECGVDFLQAFGEAGASGNPLQLGFQPFSGDRSVPDPFQGYRLLEVGPHLLFKDPRGDGLVERFGGPELVSEIDFLNGALGLDTLPEADITGLGSVGANEQYAGNSETAAETCFHGSPPPVMRVQAGGEIDDATFPPT